MLKHSNMRIFIVLLSSSIIMGSVACNSSASENRDSSRLPTASISDQLPGEPSAHKAVQLSPEEMQSAEKQYLVPSPGEVLNSLDKLDRVSWSQLASYDSKADYDNKFARSLNLGVRVADAFMAVHAQDAARFGEMSTIVFDLAREIGLGDVLEDQRGKLDNLASEGRWEELKAALDNVQTDVRDEVERLGEDELVVLASAGGWLEGMRAVTAHLKDDYSVEKAELLQQQSLISYFIQEFEAMEGTRAAQNPLVQQMQRTLDALLPLVEVDKAPSIEATVEINELTRQLLAKIEAGK